MQFDIKTKRRVLAWILLVSVVAIHIVDEILTDFLPFYNQFVTDMRSELGFFPLPTYSYNTWIGGVWVAVILGYLLTPMVGGDSKLIRIFFSVIAVLMFINGLLHLSLSWYFGTWVPGASSSPLLLFASVYFFARLWFRPQT